MRITCALCGPRDRREFYYHGAALPRPSDDEWSEEWNGYVHLRENPAGETAELWFHEAGCGVWLRVVRNTATHEVISVEQAG